MNKTVKRIVACSVIAASMMTLPLAAKSEVMLISENPGDIPAVTDTVKESTAKHMTIEGTVTAVEPVKEVSANGYRITLDNESGGIVFHAIKELVPVIDQKENKYVTIEDIKVGDRLTAILPKDSPMTMSLPPQSSSAVLFVIGDEAGSVNVSKFSEDLVNEENTLKLNISEDTVIVDLKGTKRVFTEEDVKNSEAVVLYGASTKCIPAQTTPQRVIILEKEAVAEELPAELEALAKEQDGIKYYPLRKIGEHYGFTVIWNQEKQSVILQTSAETYQLAIGSKSYSYNEALGDKVALELEAPVLMDGVTYVPASFVAELTK